MVNTDLLEQIAREIDEINNAAKEYEEKKKNSIFSPANLEKIRQQNAATRRKIIIKKFPFFRV